MNLEKINKKHELIQNLRSLIKGNYNDNYVFTDDINIIELAMKKGLKIHQLFVCDDENNPYKPQTIAFLNEAIKVAEKSYAISRQTFALLSQKDNSIGVIALIEANLHSLDKLTNKNFIVVCDGLENPGNLGTIYRTADSAQVDAIICADPVTKLTNPKLTSSARGCNLLIPTATAKFEETQKWLIDNNYEIYLGEPLLGSDYQYYDYNGKIAIIIGGERFGINPKWYDGTHKKVFIPMLGSNNSLNVGVAASILIYEAMMKRKKKQG